jgi:eukaryotic-like serine/threonine-protein kinase
MQPQRWNKIKEIYSDAREQDPANRATFLAQACGGDDDLRREVELLPAS